jgi:nicotinate (nicotinamide) nucleotide adenylyltransferase
MLVQSNSRSNLKSKPLRELMSQTVAIYGGSFNPPGLHHGQIVQQVKQHFDAVIVVPCGPRPDKIVNDHIPPTYRAAMADMAFGGIPGVEVDLFDLEQATFTRTHGLQERYANRGYEVWHVVGADLIVGGHNGQSFIQRKWERGEELWKTLNFAVVNRPGHNLAPDDLPPKHRFIRIEQPGSTEEIRELIYRGDSIAKLVPPMLGAYIDRHGLYSGSLPPRSTRIRIGEPKIMIFHDERNAKANTWAKQLEPYVSSEPNLIVAIGGDGTMLQAIQKHWRKRIPFFGLNAGTLGFLLNDMKDMPDGKIPDEIVMRQMPMLYVEMQQQDDTWINDLTFNDAWIERASGQSAWLEVKVDGKVRIPKLVCDGALVGTPAASTAYARSMGAMPLLADTPAWLLVGSNVMSPPRWKSALLSLDAMVEISTHCPKVIPPDTEKRPLNGHMSGKRYKDVRAMRARVSRIAAVELGFCASRDMADKITQLQFS